LFLLLPFAPFVVVPLAAGSASTSATAPSNQPTAPSSQPTAPSSQSESSANTPTPPNVSPDTRPYNPYTGRPLEFDPQTGTLVVPRDPTTGLPLDLVDESGQPIILRDASGQLLEGQEPEVTRADSLLRAEGPGGRAVDPEGGFVGRSKSEGGRRYHLRMGVVEGYTSNALETETAANAPIVEHHALFTGVEGSADMLTWTGDHDPLNFHVAGRFQHYVTLDGTTSIDDGTLNGAAGGVFTLGKRTLASLNLAGTLTSANSALVSDGPLFQVNPANLTYTLEYLRGTLAHEVAKKWRVIFGADAWMGTTVSAGPAALPAGGVVYHSGFDFISPGVDVAVNHDFGPFDIGSLLVRYTASYSAFVLDYSKNPPTYSGSAWNQNGSVLATLTHSFNERLRAILSGGAALAEAPPLDVDQSPVLAPAGAAVLIYQRPYWLATASGSLSYGSANPRLGYGPSQGGGLVLSGLPSPHGRWANLAVSVSGSLSNSSYAAGAGVNVDLVYAGLVAEGRYALNRWLGLAAGYNFTYIDFQTAGASTPFKRQVGFVGLSGYWANDGTLPTLESFGLAVTPPS
jgi:hypothetical protein